MKPQENKIITLETFREIGSYELGNLKQDNPSVFNGILRVKKYKITIEEIEEPKEVIQKRLQTLWDNCNNSHHWTPLRNAADKIGYEFKSVAGNAKNKTK